MGLFVGAGVGVPFGGAKRAVPIPPAALVALYDGWSADWSVDSITTYPDPVITDPGFDNDLYWTKSAGTWTVGGSAANHAAGGASQIYRITGVGQVTGNRYQQLIDVSSISGGMANQYHSTPGPSVGAGGVWPVSMTAGGTRYGLSAAATTVCSVASTVGTCTTVTTCSPGATGPSFVGMTLSDATAVTRPFKETWGGVSAVRFNADKHATALAAATHNFLHDGTGCTWVHSIKPYSLPAAPAVLFATCATALQHGAQCWHNADGTVTVRIANGTGVYALDVTSVVAIDSSRWANLVGRWASAYNYEVWLDGVKIIDAAVVAPSANDASSVLTEGALPGVASYELTSAVAVEGCIKARISDEQLAGLGLSLSASTGKPWAAHVALTASVVACGAATEIDTATYDAFGVLYVKTDGSLYYVYREGTTHALDNGYLKYRTSTDGVTWSGTTTLWGTGLLDYRNCAGGQESVGGRWWVFFTIYDTGTGEMHAFRSWSDDEGASWQAPEAVVDGANCHGPLVQWGDYRGVFCRCPVNLPGFDCVVAWDSADARILRPIRDEVLSSFQGGEGALVGLGGEKLLGFIRDADDSQMKRVYSEDAGLTWECRACDIPRFDPVPQTITAYAHASPWLERRPDGTCVLWYVERETLAGPLGYRAAIRSIAFDPYLAIHSPDALGNVPEAPIVEHFVEPNSRNAGYPSRAGDFIMFFAGPMGNDVDLQCQQVSFS